MEFIILAALVLVGISWIHLLNKIVAPLDEQEELTKKDIFGYKEINKTLTKNEEQ
jgi:hypothetical protein